MALVSTDGMRKMRDFLVGKGLVISIRKIDEKFVLITGICRSGTTTRLVVDVRSRFARELFRCSQLAELQSRSQRESHSLKTPHIVELPSDHPSEHPHVFYRVTQPRVIPLPFTKTQWPRAENPRRRGISHLLGDVDIYCCQVCYKHFDRKWNKERHERKCMLTSIDYRCPVCSEIYKRCDHFARHVKTHTNSKEAVLALTTPVKDGSLKDDDLNKLFHVPYNFPTVL